jgi:hypothetical protein
VGVHGVIPALKNTGKLRRKRLRYLKETKRFYAHNMEI